MSDKDSTDTPRRYSDALFFPWAIDNLMLRSFPAVNNRPFIPDSQGISRHIPRRRRTHRRCAEHEEGCIQRLAWRSKILFNAVIHCSSFLFFADCQAIVIQQIWFITVSCPALFRPGASMMASNQINQKIQRKIDDSMISDPIDPLSE
jgi:hypothetical protein